MAALSPAAVSPSGSKVAAVATAVTFTQTPVFPDGSLALADLDIDGGTDIGAAIVDADLFIVDDGAGGTNRKVTAARIKTYAGFEPNAAQVFNESGADVDFRVESNGVAEMLVVNGGSNRVGVGEDVPLATLHIKQADSGTSTVNADTSQLVIEDDSTAGITLLGGTSGGTGAIFFGDSDDNDIGIFEYDHGANTFQFKIAGGECITMDGSRNVFFTKTAANDQATGTQFVANGSIWNVLNAQGYNIINRASDDGVLIYLKQANSTEGSIAVSGTTVAYNTFTGTHWSRLADNSKPTILRGTVMESLDAMVDWYNLEFDDSNGDPQKISHLLTGSQSNGDEITYNHNGTDFTATIVKETDIKHVQTRISTTDEAKNVYGVFLNWDFGDDDGINDMLIAAVGTYVVRVKSGQTVAKGDLLQSNGDGTAKVLNGDTSITANVLSTVFAKVLSNTKIETYADGSFIVPCAFTNC